MPTNDQTILVTHGTGPRPSLHPIEVEYQDARGITCRTHYSQPVLVGRGEDCGLRIMHSGVSRHHLAIFPEEGRWWVRDLSSSNGTLIDGRRIGTIGKPRLDWAHRLASLVPPRCWQVFQTFGDLQSRADGEFRLAHWQKNLTTARRLQPWLPLAFLAAGGCVFAPKLVACWNAQFFPAWWKPVALACLALVMLWPCAICSAFLYYSARAFADRIRETEEALVQFSAVDKSAGSAGVMD